MVYNADDLSGIEVPDLRFGDKKTTKEFRVKYLTYVAKHDNKMRTRPGEHRLLIT